jgi:hypothetical protein
LRICPFKSIKYTLRITFTAAVGYGTIKYSSDTKTDTNSKGTKNSEVTPILFIDRYTLVSKITTHIIPIPNPVFSLAAYVLAKLNHNGFSC